MWKKLLRVWEVAAARRAAQQNEQTRTRISLAAQKWFSSGECLRIIEVEADGSKHKIAVWNGKACCQMVELGATASPKNAATLSLAAGGGIA